MFAKPQLCLIFSFLLIPLRLFSMYNLGNKPINFSSYTKKSSQSDKNFNSEGGRHFYKPKGYFSDEEVLDRVLVDQVIEQAPGRVKLLIANFEHRDEVLRNKRLQRMLLYGLSGNGKTLLAKAIALKTVGKYYFIQTPDLLDSWKNCHQNLNNEIDFLAERNEPMAIIFDEIDQISNQYKNKNSHDANMPTALWSLLDRCARSFPHFFFIGTTNNEKNDFPEQLISRFGKNNMIAIPNPIFEVRKQLICYYLNKRKHDISENEINEFAQRMEGRTCRDIETIIDDASLLSPKNNKIITLNEIRLAEEENPYEPTQNEILARNLNISMERLVELNAIQFILESKRDLIDYHYKKSNYDLSELSLTRQDNHHNENIEQSERHHDACFNQARTHHEATINQTNVHQNANLEQANNHHEENLAQSERQHNATIEQGANHHNESYAQLDQHYMANFNQTIDHHNANLAQSVASHNQAAAQHNANLAQATFHHNATMQQAQMHHQDNNHRQDVDTMVDGVTTGIRNGMIGGIMGGPTGALFGVATGVGPALVKNYFK